MSKDTFKPIFDTLKTQLSELAVKTFSEYRVAARADALSVLNQLKEVLEIWTVDLAEGKLSQADFEFLVLAQKELIEMNALKQAGLALIKADEFKAGVLKMVITTISSLVKL
jgi:hypothetical protein